MNRISEARKRAGLSQKQLAHELKVSCPTVSEWESGKKTPNSANLQRLSVILNSTVDYLLGNESLQNEYTVLSDIHKNLINLYDNANIQAQKTAEAALELGQINNSNMEDVPAPTEYIRHYLLPAAAGYAAPIEGEDYELIPKTAKTPRNADFCISIQGDSMEPYIQDGQIIYVQRDASLTDFDVGVFFVDGDVLCKQYCVDHDGSLYLLSANPAREDANRHISRGSSSTVVCFGKVLLDKKLPQPKYY